MKGKIFNAQEVQAILAGNKTQFREVIKPCKQHPKCLCVKERNCHTSIDFKEDGLFWQPIGGEPLQPLPFVNSKLSDSVSLDKYSPYKVGQKIFVKESFCRDPRRGVNYKQEFLNHDLPEEFAPDWISASYMQKWASRLTLLIKSVEVERLGDISEEDVRKEGHDLHNEVIYSEIFLKKFKDNWNATHKKPEEKFEASPWVFCYNFEVVR